MPAPLVVAIRHSPLCAPGTIQTALESRGVELRILDAGSAAVRAAEGAAGIIVLGGPMSANDDLPWMEAELALIRRAVEREQPVFGVCLGGQLLAKALGARVSRNPVKEIGWFEIHLNDRAGEDPLFQGMAPVQPVFQWHGDTFAIPEGAVALASSERCANQAFRIGRAAYGIQFHPEVTPGIIAAWCADDALCGDAREVEGRIDPHLHFQQLAGFSDTLFGRWVKSLRVPATHLGNSHV